MKITMFSIVALVVTGFICALICYHLGAYGWLAKHDHYVEKALDTTPVFDPLLRAAEVGYMEGQKDAIHGDIRITLSPDYSAVKDCWVWLKSPWDGGTVPIYKSNCGEE